MPGDGQSILSRWFGSLQGAAPAGGVARAPGQKFMTVDEIEGGEGGVARMEQGDSAE